jgi:glutamine synthetase
MHVHQSLWNGKKNLFSGRDKFGLSKLAKKYLTGLIAYGPMFTLVWNQWVNSYKRLVPGHEAPTYLTWGVQNRSAYVRVPENIKGKPGAARVELRSPDPALNPYLGFACMLSAGLAGHFMDMKVPNPVEENIYTADWEEILDKMYGKPKNGSRTTYRWELPANLGEAIELFRENELAEATLGKHIVDELIRNKRHEWRQYCKHVTDFEIDNYLPKL